MSHIPESVRARLQKLMARATDDRGTDENSAAIAMAKLQAMLAEYNLEMSQVSADEGEASVDAAREKLALVIPAEFEWQSELLEAITRCNFCLGSRDWNRKRIYTLVGRSVNIKATVQVYTYLVGTIDRLCPIVDGRRQKAILSFKKGCSDRLRSRLWQQRSESEAASQAARGDVARGSGSDLVLSDVYSSEDDLNRDLWNGLPVGTSARERIEREARWATEREARWAARTRPAVPSAPETPAQRKEREASDRRWQRNWDRARRQEASKIDHDAYALGQSAGASISLDRQIEHSGLKPAQIAV